MRTHRIERFRVRREDSRSDGNEWVSWRTVLRIPRNIRHATQGRRRTVRTERHRMERHRFSAVRRREWASAGTKYGKEMTIFTQVGRPCGRDPA